MRAAFFLIFVACSTPTSSPSPAPSPSPSPPPAPTSTGTTIVIGGGGAKVTGGPKMTGLSVACAAFQACCAEHAGKATPPGMACDLAPVMSNGDCSRAVTIVRDSFTAQKTPIPAGCVVLGDLAGAPTSTGRPKVLIGAP